jgi:hypothetical protein
MISITDTGKFIYELLKQCRINIYPVIAENSAAMPFAVYRRETTEHRHKDSILSEATYSIDIIAEQYDRSIEILQTVLTEFRRKLHEYNGTAIRLAVLNTSEDYEGGAYVQTVQLSVEINNLN